MTRQQKNQLLVLSILLFGILVGVAGAIYSAPAGAIAAPTITPAVPEPRPEPPTIETWGIPDPQGGEPAECAGQAGCGVMCFYVSENAAANEFELSCIAWIFE